MSSVKLGLCPRGFLLFNLILFYFKKTVTCQKRVDVNS